MMDRPDVARRPRHRRGRLARGMSAVVAGTALLGLAGAMTGCTRVPGVYVAEKPDAAGGTRDETFNAASYAEGIWASKVVPTVAKEAVDATTVLPAIAADPAAAGKQYGVQLGVGSPYSIMVKGSGTVLSVDQSQGAGRITVDLEPSDGKPDLSIAVGPVFLGTALRDAVGFIKFGEFPNQIEYANVATALNTRVKDDVVSKVDVAAAKGQTVTFAGAFQVLDPKNIVVTPTELQVTG